MKRGRHKLNCRCDSCKAKRQQKIAAELPGESTESASVGPTGPSGPSAGLGPESTTTPEYFDGSKIEEIIKEGEVKKNILAEKYRELIKKEEKIGEEKKQVEMEISKLMVKGSFFMFIGNYLANITKVEEYRIDKDNADLLAETTNTILQMSGKTINPIWFLLIMLALWLIPPTLILLWRHREKIKIGGLFGKLFGSREDVKKDEIQKPT
ncbi:MAG: hypothetical protein AB1779_04835 [Candidatus Thermoplasmatota archaeon]